MVASLQITPALEFGLLRASAALEAPHLVVDTEGGIAMVTIEEAGVVIELEFPCAEALARFGQRLASATAGGDDAGHP